MRFPTVSNDGLPGNMIAFSMPVKAGADGMMQFRYDTRSKTLFTDMKGEDDHGMPAQFDNVKINSTSTIPDLQRLWDLTAPNRAMYDAEFLESQGGAPAPVDTGRSVFDEALQQRTELDVDPDDAAQRSYEFHKNREKEQLSEMGAAPAIEQQLLGNLYTEDQMLAIAQRENDRMLINMLFAALEVCADPKDKILPIMAEAFKTNTDQYHRNFVEVADEGIDEIDA